VAALVAALVFWLSVSLAFWHSPEMKSAENGNGHNVCQTKASGSKRLESATKQLGE